MGFTRRTIDASRYLANPGDLTKDYGKPAVSQAFSATRTLTAAGKKIDPRKKEDVDELRYRVYVEWQNDAWGYYDAIGEIKYGLGMLAAVMSRIRLYPALNLDSDSVPISMVNYRRRQAEQSPPEVEIDVKKEMSAPPAITEAVMLEAERIMRDLARGPGGMPGFLRVFTLNMAVAGECYILPVDNVWMIKSSSELVVDAGGNILLRRQRSMGGIPTNGATGSSTGLGDINLPKDTDIKRLWREHPRYSLEPESSMMSLREVCDELITLQQMIRAVARSNINAGILFVPDDVTAAGMTPAEDIQTEEQELNEMTDSLYENITSGIIDETDASTVVPNIFRGPGEAGKNINWIDIGRKADQYLVERCDRTLDRVLQGLDMPKDFVQGLSNVRYCVDPETKVLTRVGWRAHTELAVGDEVLTLDHETGLSEWQPVQDVAVFDVKNEKMLSIEQRGHSSLSTMDHRWPVTRQSKRGDVREWATSGTLTANDRLHASAYSSDLPDTEKYTDALVELAAWFYTEGHVRKSKPITRASLILSESGEIYPRMTRRWGTIAQSEVLNPQHTARIEAALTLLFGAPSYADGNTPCARQRPTWRKISKPHSNTVEFLMNEECLQALEPLFSDFQEKVLHREFLYSLTQAQLDLFIAVSIWADGSGDPSGSAVFTQKGLGRTEIFELACHLAGRPISRRIDSHRPNMYSVLMKKRTQTQPHRAKKAVVYTGKVWCPVTENQTWFAQRNGTFYWTGNTNAVSISESLYKSHVEPTVLMLVDALTSVYLIPRLIEKFPELKKDFDAQDVIKVWYDPSEIVTKSDPAESADKGYDKMTLSANAWREAHGFADTDAPSELELGMRLLQKASLPPELVTTLFNQLLKSITSGARTDTLQQMPVPFPESAQDTLGYDTVVPEDGSPPFPRPTGLEGAPPGAELGDPADILPEGIAASGIRRGRLYTIPYNGNEMQAKYRTIAEAAVRSGEASTREFPTSSLTPTQPMDRTTSAGGAGAKDLPPIVIKVDGVNYLLDGHHRAMRKRAIVASFVDVANLRTDLSA